MQNALVHSRFVAIGLLALALVGCGGGSQNNQTAAPDATLVGYFYDAPVEGLDYRACPASGSTCRGGVTGQDGRFQYQAGDVVQFSLAGLRLGEAKGQPLVTPYHLNTQPERVTQTLQLLQSADDDSDTSNGIKIDAATRQRAATAFVQPVSLADQNTAEVLAVIRPDASLVSADAALSHGEGSKKLDRLLRADSEVAKAILGKKYYNLSDPDFNVEKLNSSMWHRMMLQLYYDRYGSLNNSFSILEENYKNIANTRDGAKEIVGAMKSAADIALLGLDADPKNSIEVARLGVKVGASLVSAVNSTAKGVGLIAGMDAVDIPAMSSEAQEVMNVIAAGLVLDPSDVGTAVDLEAKVANATFIKSETSQTAINAISGAAQCALGLASSPTGPAQCWATAAELYAGAVVDLFSAGRLSGNQEYMNAHTAAQDYLAAWYKSGMDANFMLKRYGIPKALESAADYFDADYKNRNILFKNGIDKAYFKSEISRFLISINQLSKYYRTHLGLAGDGVKVELSATSGLFNGHEAGQGVPAVFQANVVAAQGVTNQQLDWYVYGAEGKAYAIHATTPLEQGKSTATIVFQGAGAFNVAALVTGQGRDGFTQAAVGVFSVAVKPEAGKLNLSPDPATSRWSVGQRLSAWISQLWAGVKSIVIRIGTQIAWVLGIDTDGKSTTANIVLEKEGVQTVTVSYYDQTDGTGNLVGLQTREVNVQPALPEPVVLSEAVRLSDGRVRVAGLAQAGIAVRVIWPDAATSSVIADESTGEWSVTSTSNTYSVGEVVQAVAYSNAGESAVKDLRISGLASVSTSKLPHTGVTSAQCYQAGSDTLVACDSDGAVALSGAGKQDGMYPSVNAMSYSAVGSYSKEECVKDNVTDLLWEGKSAYGPRAGSNTYTNYHSSYYGSQEQMDAATNTYGYVAYVNSVALCGYTDWRLPTVDELQTLVDYSKPYPGPTINATWFPNTPPRTLYWTSSPNVNYSGNAWLVGFSSGGVVSESRSYVNYTVRLVRASQ